MSDDERQSLRLTGYGPSVYTWAVRIALAELGLDHDYAEANPFVARDQETLARENPFGRVPVLAHGRVRIYETAAILDYLDAEFGGGVLTPAAPLARARMRQVIGIADAHGYWPLVRQVFSNAVFTQLEGETGDPAALAEGLAASRRVLAALETIAAEGEVLAKSRFTLADYHLFPMIDYFAQAGEGRRMIEAAPALADWFGSVGSRPSVAATRPVLTRAETGVGV